MTPPSSIPYQLAGSQDTLDIIRAERERAVEQLRLQGDKIKQTARSLLAPGDAPANKWKSAVNVFQNGMAIFRGIQMGLSVFYTVRSLFGGRRRRSRRW